VALNVGDERVVPQRWVVAISPATVNDRVYIHEIIDVVGHNRAHYMQHMTANWSPIGQEERGQLCYGVWALLGSTGAWPKTVNMWEHASWSGLATSFEKEAVGRGAQDPALERWWAKAAEFRSGGLDRIMVPAPWTRTIVELCEAGVRGDVYAHELMTVEPGGAADVLERAREAGPLHAQHGWELVGAFTTAMASEHEALLLWAIPSWQQWADGERDDQLARWRRGLNVRTLQRALLVDAPLSPLRIGRQPSRADRVDWQD
jgi:hypothetical protein